MENLIFSINATVPVFLMMILGLFFNRIGWLDDELAAKLNRFVFRVPLPILVFNDLASVDVGQSHLTEAAPHFWALLLSRTSTAVPGWPRL